MSDVYVLPTTGRVSHVGGMELVEFLPHVWGYTSLWSDGTLAIPVIQSDMERAGHGGRFLDSLPKDVRIAFPTVVSGILSGMLSRRGFRFEENLIYAVELGEWVDGWVRP